MPTKDKRTFARVNVAEKVTNGSSSSPVSNLIVPHSWRYVAHVGRKKPLEGLVAYPALELLPNRETSIGLLPILFKKVAQNLLKMSAYAEVCVSMPSLFSWIG